MGSGRLVGIFHRMRVLAFSSPSRVGAFSVKAFQTAASTWGFRASKVSLGLKESGIAVAVAGNKSSSGKIIFIKKG
jgi:hypothetical protein